MLSRLLALGVVALTLGGTDSIAQTLPKEFGQFMPKEYQELMIALTAAQARAIRPGDEAMGCPAIEKELLASMNDPAIQAYAARMEGALSKEGQAKGAATPQAAAALLGALGGGSGVPAVMGGNLLAGAAQAQAAQQQAQALQALQDPAAQLKLMAPILPQMMRAQRLVGLALVRTCPWVFGAFPGAVPPPLPGPVR